MWRRAAGNANAMAVRLADGVRDASRSRRSRAGELRLRDPACGRGRGAAAASSSSTSGTSTRARCAGCARGTRPKRTSTRSWRRSVDADAGTNTAGYEAPIGLTADPVVFTLLDGRLCVLLGAPARGAPARDVRAAGRVRGRVRGARADGRAQAAREDGRRLGASRAAAHLRRSVARPARLAALDRLHGARAAGDAARRSARRTATRPGTRSTGCRSSRWITPRSSRTGCGGCTRAWPTRSGSCARRWRC